MEKLAVFGFTFKKKRKENSVPKIRKKKKKVFSNSNAMGVFKNKNVFFLNPKGLP